MSELRTSPRPTGATAALAGGTLWALLTVATRLAGPDDLEHGSLQFVGVVAVLWLFLVLAPLLLLPGLRALRAALGPSAGRTAVAGTVVAGVGYAAMAAGNGIELTSITAGGGEVGAGHAVFLIGFLVAAVGGVLLGIVVVRQWSEPTARTAGVLLIGAVPLGIAVGWLGSSLERGQDAWFWAAISLPTGLAWVLLGRFLATRSATAVPAPAAAR